MKTEVLHRDSRLDEDAVRVTLTEREVLLISLYLNAPAKNADYDIEHFSKIKNVDPNYVKGELWIKFAKLSNQFGNSQWPEW